MKTWINFKELRSKLDFEKILQHYRVETKRRGDQLHAFCPLPNHQGKKNSPSFSANVVRGIFKCFGCGQKGNVLEFAALMENVNSEDGRQLHELALKLRDQFCPEGTRSGEAQSQNKERDRIPALVNSPLDFELQGLDPNHPYLLGRGFKPETVGHFQLGFCSRGYLKDRVAIPLHDHRGRLVGYAGRLVDDNSAGSEYPRYLFPGKRERGGKVLEFQKSRLLYNVHRVGEAVDNLIVVEGFASVWWLHQHHQFPSVATMGVECSERQAELIVSLVKKQGKLWVMPDGDDAGQRFAKSLLLQLASHRFVRWVRLRPGSQPTDLSADQLNSSFVM